MLIPKVTTETKIKAADYNKLAVAVTGAQTTLSTTSRKLSLVKPSGAKELRLFRNWKPITGQYTNDVPAVTGKVYLYNTEGQTIPSWYNSTDYTLTMRAEDITGLPNLNQLQASGKLLSNTITCSNTPLSIKMTGSEIDDTGNEYATFSIPMGPVPTSDTLLYIKPSLTQENIYHMLSATGPNSITIYTCSINWTSNGVASPGELIVQATNHYTLPGLPASGDPFEYIRDFACYTYRYSPTAPYGTYTDKLALAVAIRQLGTGAGTLLINYESAGTSFYIVPGFTQLNGVGASPNTLYTDMGFVVSAVTVPWVATPQRIAPASTEYEGTILSTDGKSITIAHQTTQAGYKPGAITHTKVTSVAQYGGPTCYTSPIVSNSLSLSMAHFALPSQGVTIPIFQTPVEATSIASTITWDSGTEWVDVYNHNWMMAGVANVQTDAKDSTPSVYIRNLEIQSDYAWLNFGTSELTSDANYVTFSATNFPTATLVSPYVTGTHTSSTLIICAGSNQIFIVDTDKQARISARRPVYIKGLSLAKSYTIGLTTEYSTQVNTAVDSVITPTQGILLDELLLNTPVNTYPYKRVTATNLQTCITQDKPVGWSALMDMAATDWDNVIAPTMFSEDASIPPVVDGSAACLLYGSTNTVYPEATNIPLPITKCLFIPSVFLTGSTRPASDTIFTDRLYTTDSMLQPTVTSEPYETINCRAGNVCKTIELPTASLAGQSVTANMGYETYMLTSVNKYSPNQFVQMGVFSIQYLDASYTPIITGGLYRQDVVLTKADTLSNATETDTRGIYGFHKNYSGNISQVFRGVMPTGTKYIRIAVASGVWSSNGRLPADTKTKTALIGGIAIHNLKVSVQ
jgi:hypothetical protein